MEPVEDSFMVLRRNPNACINNGNGYLISLLARAYRYATSSRGELHRIREQIQQYLLDPQWIAPDRRFRL